MTFLADKAQIAQRSGQPLSVVSFDIDHFKRINDTYGHDGGDKALVRVSKLACGVLRRSDRVGRVGGEEFLLVLPDTAQDTAAEIAERARRDIASATLDELAPDVHTSISLGVSAWINGKDDVEALIKRADEALYRAKEGGRNRVELG